MKGDRETDSAIVCFIACPTKIQDFTRISNRDKFIQTVRNAIEAGADIINISLSKIDSNDITRMEYLIRVVKSILDAEWVSSVAQLDYFYRSIGSVLTCFANSRDNLKSYCFLDPEVGLPANLLTVSVGGGKLCIVTTSLPMLPRRTRARLLEHYAKAAANADAETILIGGACEDAVLFLENQIAKLDVEFELVTNANLCLLANASKRSTVECIAMDTQAPFSLLAIVDTKAQLRNASNAQRTSNAQRSAEQPAHDPVMLRAATPLYDNLIANLEPAARQHPQGNGFIEYITKSCFFDNILTVDVYGERLEKPIPLAVKMERLLETANRQRELYIGSSSLPANTDLNSLCIESDGMRNIFNNWRAHPEK